MQKLTVFLSHVASFKKKRRTARRTLWIVPFHFDNLYARWLYNFSSSCALRHVSENLWQVKNKAFLAATDLNRGCGRMCDAVLLVASPFRVEP
jgi:hypothetical protein